jgi:hypothetical protein
MEIPGNEAGSLGSKPKLIREIECLLAGVKFLLDSSLFGESEVLK